MRRTSVIVAVFLALAAAARPDELTPERRQELEKKAEALTKEGVRQYEADDYAKAQESFRQALDIRRTLYPRDKFPQGHADLAAALGWLGGAYQAAGELGKAEPLFKEELDMARALYPKDKYPQGHADLVRGINHLADLYHDARQYGKAEPLLREAVDVLRRLYPKEKYPDGNAELAHELNELGHLLLSRGEYVQAEPLFREAVAMRRALYPKDRYPQGHADLAADIENLGYVLAAREDYAKAEPLLREALEMNRRLYPKEKFPDGHFAIVVGLANLGSMLNRQGEYAKSEPVLRECLEMSRRLYPKGKFPDGHEYLALALNNVGHVLQKQQKYDEAESFYQQALEMERRLYPKEKYPAGHRSLAATLDNLSYLCQMRGEYARAEPYVRESLELTRLMYPADKFPAGHNELATSVKNMGRLLDLQGRYDEAEPFTREALEMNRRLYPPESYPAGHPELVRSLSYRGALFRARGDAARAEPLLREALVLSQRLALSHAELAAEAETLNYIASLPLTRDAFLSVTRRLPADPSAYDPLWEARAPLTRLLERRHRDLLASRDDEARALGHQLIEARQRLAYLLLHPGRDPGQHRKDVEQRTEAKEELERRLARQLKVAPRRTDRKQVTPRRLSELLPEAAAFVDLLRYTDVERDPKVPGKKGEKYTERYAAFVLRRGAPPARVELKEAAAIDAAWADWRKAITADRPDEPAERRAAARLADLVWKPLRAALPAELRTAYLAPEGKLSQVPWGALPGEKPGTVLLDECAVCLVPHGPFLLERLEEKAASSRSGGTLVAYGGVDYAQPPEAVVKGDDRRAPVSGGKRVVWKDLPGTAREQEQVTALARAALKDRPIARSGRAASTGQLLADLPRARYAHLATHGFFADPQFRSALQVDPALFAAAVSGERRGGARSPLVLSGLVLAGANREGQEAPPDRGILTAEGLIELPLEGLELAVLSACETGLGEDGGGEGVYGLQRAFHVAGCQSVIASLWKVDDAATQALMALFYRNLWERRLDPAEALRQAQLALYRHPEAAAVAQKRGVDFSEADLPKVEDRPADKPRRSPTAQWAAFTFSGVRPVPEGK
jgi:CHAT domain-containing protein/tetratricopeptide (TPR) repeat protein